MVLLLTEQSSIQAVKRLLFLLVQTLLFCNALFWIMALLYGATRSKGMRFDVTLAFLAFISIPYLLYIAIKRSIQKTQERVGQGELITDSHHAPDETQDTESQITGNIPSSILGKYRLSFATRPNLKTLFHSFQTPAIMLTAPISQKKVIFTSLFLLIGIGIFFGTWYTVDSKERGVVLRNGRIIKIAEPGLHFKIPIMDSVNKISIQHQALVFDKLSAYSKDQQPAELRVSISYHVPPDQVANVYTEYGNISGLESRVMSRQAPTQVENVFGQFNAVSAVQNRVKLIADISQALRDNIKGPVVIDSLQVENIDFSQAYENAISARMNAEVAVATRNQDLEKERVEAKIVVTKAQAEADSALARATAEAQATKLRGDAEAGAIRAKADALAQNQNLVELIRSEKWDGKLPTQMIPGATIPFFNIKQ
jgi:regulator of protease activity HflC (stomatin/prohibitin superfamily)